MDNRIYSSVHIFALSLIACLIALSNQASTPCALREYSTGLVCVCNASYCDYLDDPTPSEEYVFTIVSSSKAGLRFEPTNGQFNLYRKYYILDYGQRLERAVRASTNRHVLIEVDRDKRLQTITGFGGAISGAVTYILDKLPQALQDHLYRSFYSQGGIGFNLMRTPIGGCDFDLEPWAYNEQPVNDVTLSNFTKLDPREQKRVEQIKRLKQVSKVENLRIKAAAWSSPPWMKTNNAWTGHGSLKREYYQLWADYHLRWLELWEQSGLPIWAISTGNEPLNGAVFMALIKFMSLGWLPRQQAIWLSQNLGPTIRSKYEDLIIFGNDDQRYTYAFWFREMKASRADSLDHLGGLAVHWYWDEIFKPAFVDMARKEMPNKLLLSTESCIGDKPWQKSAPILGSWERGEKYARALLQDLQHNFNGWIDWNIVLDEEGGPNYVGNFVDAPVIANLTNGIEVYKQPMFYTMGHFSKFIPEGSVRITAERTNINVDTVAFLRPDDSVAVVIFNSGYADVDVNIKDLHRGSVLFKIPPKSIHTVIYK